MRDGALAGAGRAEDHEKRRPEPVTARLSAGAGSRAETARSGRRRADRYGRGARARPRGSKRSPGAGCPNRFSRPQERSAARGRRPPENAGVVEPRLPWCPTFRTSALPTRLSRRSASSVGAARVAGQERAPAVPFEASRIRDWLFVASTLRRGPPEWRTASRASRPPEDDRPPPATRTGTRPEVAAASRSWNKPASSSPLERQSSPTGSSSITAKRPSGVVGMRMRQDGGVQAGDAPVEQLREGAACGRSPDGRDRTVRLHPRESRPPRVRRRIASPCPTSSASIENPLEGPRGPGRTARKRKSAAAGRKAAARALPRASAPITVSAPIARTICERRRGAEKSGAGDPLGDEFHRPRCRTRSRTTSGGGAHPALKKISRTPPSAIIPPRSGIESGAVSHAAAETTLNLQRRIGAVADWAARAAARPEKSSFGRSGSPPSNRGGKQGDPEDRRESQDGSDRVDLRRIEPEENQAGEPDRLEVPDRPFEKPRHAVEPEDRPRPDRRRVTSPDEDEHEDDSRERPRRGLFPARPPCAGRVIARPHASAT